MRTRMTPVDAVWLAMDEPTNRMMTTAMLTFDRPLDHRRLVRALQPVLASHPRFGMRAIRTRFGAAWEPESPADLAGHVRRRTLPRPGGQNEVRSLIGELLSTPLDLARSPWDITLVRGLADGRGLLVLRLLHCLADGSALLHVMDDLTERGPEEVGVSLRAHREHVASAPVRALAAARTAVSGSASILSVALSRPDPDGVLKGALGVQKLAAWTAPIALARLKAVRSAADASVNDVLLSIVAGGLSRYFERVGGAGNAQDLRVLVPVDLRALSANADVGNHFGLVYLSLPIGRMPPVDRLREMHRRTEAVKASGQAPVSYAVLGAFGLLPTSVQVPVLRFFGARGSAIVTNVPGPRAPRRLAGRTIEEIMFWVPQAARVSLGISLMSYAGTIQVGISSDASIIADPDVVARALDAELAALEAAARPERRSRAVSA